MVTVSGWYAGGGGFGDWGNECAVNGGWGNTFVHTLTKLFLKIMAEGALTTKAGS